MSAMLGAAGVGRKFNPLSIGWESLLWPGGANFRAEGYANNQVLNSGETVPDESVNGNDLTSSHFDTTLTYVKSSDVNGRPALRGESLFELDIPSYKTTYASALTSYSIVIVWYQDTIVDTHSLIMADVTSHLNFKVQVALDGALGVSMNSLFDETAASTITAGSTHGFRAKFTPTAGTAHLDGSLIVSNTATMDTFAGPEFFMLNDTSRPFSGDLAFAGVFDGDVTADPGWSKFAADVSAHYGVTI